MLEHKDIPYRRVDLKPGLHSMAVRLRGVPGKGETRMLGDRKPTPGVALGDRLGTVPALRLDGEKVQTNKAIARRLDQLRPEPPLFPADPELRAKVEEAEAWADDPFQMVARRLTLAGARRGPEAMHMGGADGRMGFLLWRNDRMRGAGSKFLAKRVFTADEESEHRMLDELPGQLDRIDAWIADGVLNGERLNAADFAIGSSLALLAYRLDLAPEIEGRPAGRLVDRLFENRVRPAKGTAHAG